MIITSLAKLVTAIAFEAIDYWFESSKMFVLYILYIQEKERSINWLVWRSPKSSVGVRVTSLLSKIKNYTSNQIRTDDNYLEGRSYTNLTILAIP